MSWNRLVEEREKVAEELYALKELPADKQDQKRKAELEKELLQLDHRLEEMEEPADSPPPQTSPWVDTLAPLKHHLDAGWHILQAAPNRGLFSRLFGRNPQALLAQHIYLASLEAEKLAHCSDEPLCSFCTRFVEEAHKRWNPHLYRTRYLELYEEFSAIYTRLTRG